MNSDLTYYIFVLVAIVAGIIFVKKITSCLFRTVFMAVILAVLAYIYWMYFR